MHVKRGTTHAVRMYVIYSRVLMPCKDVTRGALRQQVWSSTALGSGMSYCGFNDSTNQKLYNGETTSRSDIFVADGSRTTSLEASYVGVSDSGGQ